MVGLFTASIGHTCHLFSSVVFILALIQSASAHLALHRLNANNNVITTSPPSRVPSTGNLHLQNGGVNRGVDLTDNLQYFDNGVVKLGIDLTRGGSIGFFGASGNNTNNLVNCHDMGREIQLSFYSGPTFYNPGNKCNKLFMHQEWPWNPIGAGDVKGNHGTINSFSIINSSTAHVNTTPLQWACDNVPCECEFDQTITLGGPANTGAKIDAVLYNHRSDTTSYPPRAQELPAVYSNGEFYRLVTVQNGTLIELNASFDPSRSFPWIPGAFTAEENWAALVNKDGYGMGVVNFETTSFIGGFSDPSKKGSGGSFDPQTGYIAPVKDVVIPGNGTYNYTFYLVLGDVSTIRAYANQVRPESNSKV
jgi:hypothetical protein